MKKTLQLLKLPEDATDEQAAQVVSDVLAENRALKSVRYRGANLSPEQEASVLRRQRAGLSMEDAIAAELAQAEHDERLEEEAEKKAEADLAEQERKERAAQKAAQKQQQQGASGEGK